MARQTVGQPSLISSSLKDLYMGGSMTERALRLRIRELEAEGFVKSVSSETDKRSKYLVPTEVFYESIYHHAREVHRLLEKNFFLVSKEN
jgi:DNA-binding MarR family transcriptional regulator